MDVILNIGLDEVAPKGQSYTNGQRNPAVLERGVAAFRAQVRHVLLKYEGLHLVSIETFSTANEIVDAHLRAIEAAGPGERYVCLAPFHPDSPEVAQVRGRDQSEDRTLGDYINRKSY